MAIDSRYKLKTGEEVDYFPPIQNTDNPYLTEAIMHLDQANQLQGYGYLVTDVGAFTYLGTVAGTAADYKAFGANLFTAITENQHGTHPAFTSQNSLNAYLLGGEVTPDPSNAITDLEGTPQSDSTIILTWNNL